MLILVGVTINFTLNGGLITKAKQAASQTQIEADKEILMLEALRNNRHKWRITFR